MAFGLPKFPWGTLYGAGRLSSPPPVPSIPGGGDPPDMSPSVAASAPDPAMADLVAALKAALAAATIKSVQLYTPDVFPIPGAVQFQLSGSLAVAAATPNQILTGPKLPFTLQGSDIGIIKTWNIGVATNIVVTTNQLFSILFNGAPAPGASNYTFQGRAAQNYERSFDMGLWIPQGAKVELAVTDADGGAYTDFADVTGWTFAVSEAKRWLAGQGRLLGTG